MRSLPPHIRQELQDAAYELPNLPDSVIVKDAHLTDALRLIARLPRVEHARLVDTRDTNAPETQVLAMDMVFAGGTCLAKAHGTIQRMSEDIDFKLHLTEVPQGYKVGSLVSVESRLRALHRVLEQSLVKDGFSIAEPYTPQDKNPIVLDGRRYYELELDYAESGESQALAAPALRAALKLELKAQSTPIAHEMLKVGYLHRQLLGMQDPDAFEIPCVSREITLAEKALSFLRRYAWRMSGNHRGAFDTALVRHVYDIWRMTEDDPELLGRSKRLFPQLVAADALQFGAQYPAFRNEPMGVLQHTLRDLPLAEIEKDFKTRLAPLVYIEVPPFEEVFEKFRDVATELLR
ncbi:nucleotidyl transferase AbiEii/AbiGii toxin family protein [Comamonas piscis]|uniref:Nucleotidyl transferase AbiEii/AbiGii toxin family protein n=1 Tax=Comamonas piscis TaxID=1562974 RepID=A0A7G5EK14_9BURK|nr:nucleotidyl transferase AbiEii/AbiGii toxin family protein [Comamonas piscis]QMV74339.1 nucleotidyl transferase AbiEii/AbiGii toxin family protein [Comamonas piscis]WSO32786.1 nucleotidyl transferase AbiEii/AbiGii toxin family protein [Comamonas piscis]